MLTLLVSLRVFEAKFPDSAEAIALSEFRRITIEATPIAGYPERNLGQ
jgi:hypothetical protein